METDRDELFLRDADGAEKRLVLHDGVLDAPSGVKLKVWGTVNGDEIDVSSFKIVTQEIDPSQEIGSQSSALIGVTPATPRKMCVFLVDLGGGLGTITADTVNTAFFTGANRSTPSTRRTLMARMAWSAKWSDRSLTR